MSRLGLDILQLGCYSPDTEPNENVCILISSTAGLYKVCFLTTYL